MNVLQMDEQIMLQLPSTDSSCSFLLVTAGGLETVADDIKTDLNSCQKHETKIL